MKANSIIKRELSLLLTVVILFSCWVFIAPIKTKAATPGSYTVTFNLTVSNKAESAGSPDENYWTIYYTTNNGTGTATNMTIDFKTNKNYSGYMTSESTNNVNVTVPGWPTSFYFYINATTWDRVTYTVNWINVQGNRTNCSSMKNNSSAGTDKGTRTNNLSAPYAKYASELSLTNKTVEVPTNDTAKTSTISGGVIYDQYGVAWHQDPTYYQTATSTGVSISGSKISVAKNAMNAYNSQSDTWYQKTVIYGVKAGDTVLKTTASSSTNRTVTLTVKNPQYDVDFVNYNYNTGDAKLQSSKWYYNATPSFSGNTPTRDADNTYTYEHDGWSSSKNGAKLTSLPTVTNTSTKLFYAHYNPTYIDYTITFKDEDGTEISKKTYHYNDSITEATHPTKAEDNTYTYAFKAWSPTYNSKCTGNQTYTATYTPTYKTYTITFKNWDDSVISTKTDYHWGDSVAVPQNTPTKSEDDTYTYTFTGWDSEVSNTVNGNKVYKAQFDPVYKDYVVKFVNWDGTELKSDTLHWGAAVSAPSSNPTRAADNTYTYTFNGWDKEVSATCNGTVTYTAQYESHFIDYTVTFYNDLDGEEVISTKSTYHWNDDVVIPTASKDDPDGQYTYNFLNWADSNGDAIVPAAKVNGSAEYYANYEQIINTFTITFYDTDGKTVIKEVTDQPYGTVPAYVEGLVPAFTEKPSDSENHYNPYWAGASVTAAITGNTNFTLAYNAVAHIWVDDAGVVTKEANCTEKGILVKTCSVCNTPVSFDIPINPDNHKWVQHEENPVDTQSGQSGYVYFACENGCGQYMIAEYNTKEGKYKEVGEPVSKSAIEPSSQKIPSPLFNDSDENARFYKEANIDYSKRLASFKYMDSANGTQTVRFAGSVKIPAGIGYESVDTNNNIVDFGFVYTQNERIDNASDMKIGEKDKQGFDIQKMSVRENNYQKDAQGNLVLDENGKPVLIDRNIDNWSGCTVQQSDGSNYKDYITFNLVININAKNWHKEYACRPYITYNYNGLEYTVYDAGASSTTEYSTFYHRSINSLADSIMSFNRMFDVYYGVYTDSEGNECSVGTYVEDNFISQDCDYDTFCQIAQGFINDKDYVENHIIAYCNSGVDFKNKDAVIADLFKNDDAWINSARAEELLDTDVRDFFESY